jgi:hypothetical protein
MGYHDALPAYFGGSPNDDMAPTDRIRLPFRWQFVPVTDPRDGSIRWTWRAYTQTGSLAIESEISFDTLSDCMANAKARGYGNR